jgi:hypothetical protein
MPWHNAHYPPSYKDQPGKIRDKATEITNEVLKTTGNGNGINPKGRKERNEILRYAVVFWHTPKNNTASYLAALFTRFG